MTEQNDERLNTPKNIIAFVILGLFCVQTLLPYGLPVPDGRAGDMIANGAKVVETVVVLVLGAYFGDSVNAWRKDKALAASVQANATLAETAKVAGDTLAAAAPLATAPAGDTVTLSPGDSVKVAAEDDGELPASERLP